MSTNIEEKAQAIDAVREQLAKAVGAAKCHPCGCFHSTVEALATSELAATLQEELRESRGVFTPKKYDCLGCAECFPAIAANAVSDVIATSGGLELCPTDAPDERRGWPPLPGDYHVIRYRAAVAVCTLNSADVAQRIATAAPEGLAIVGTMQTENLGIERVIRNVIANGNIRFLVLCGTDTQQAIGHLPGQSLESLFHNGIDERGRIRGAKGKRPVLKNVTVHQVNSFTGQVELISMIGEHDERSIAEKVRELAAQRREPVVRTVDDVAAEITRAIEPKKMISDPSGFFVVYPEAAAKRILVEHYTNDGVLNHIIEGSSPAAIYSTIIEKNLISRLDHAAYLGRELARATHCMEAGEAYVQDRAPGELATPADCGCASSCR